MTIQHRLARLDHLDVNSGGGNDRVRVSAEAGARLAVAVDMGTGQR